MRRGTAYEPKKKHLKAWTFMTTFATQRYLSLATAHNDIAYLLVRHAIVAPLTISSRQKYPVDDEMRLGDGRYFKVKRSNITWKNNNVEKTSRNITTCKGNGIT